MALQMSWCCLEFDHAKAWNNAAASANLMKAWQWLHLSCEDALVRLGLMLEKVAKLRGQYLKESERERDREIERDSKRQRETESGKRERERERSRAKLKRAKDTDRDSKRESEKEEQQKQNIKAAKGNSCNKSIAQAYKMLYYDMLHKFAQHEIIQCYVLLHYIILL